MAEPVGDPGRPLPVSFILGVAFHLPSSPSPARSGWISERLFYIGPLDRATFGWVVVIPVWISAPIVAGFAWPLLPQRAPFWLRSSSVLRSAESPQRCSGGLLRIPTALYGVVRTPSD